jgi:hypothetical protein
MAKIGFQIKELRKMVTVPYKIEYVDRFIPRKDFKNKVIYIHITIQRDKK